MTAEEVREAARRWFVPERLNRVTIVPPGGAPKAAAEAAAAGQGKVRLDPLPNGLRVLVKRHANLPLVNIQAFVLGGSLLDSEKTAGRAALLADMLDQGTADHTAEEIARYFDSIGGRLSFGAGRFTVLRQRHHAAGGLSAGGRPVRRVLHAARFPRRAIRQDAGARPGGHRQPLGRSAGRDRRTVRRSPARRLALSPGGRRQGRIGAGG